METSPTMEEFREGERISILAQIFGVWGGCVWLNCQSLKTNKFLWFQNKNKIFVI
jgi:hypothetical protein